MISGMALGAAAVLGGIVAAAVTAALVHHGYAWRTYRAAKAAVPVTRRIWLFRLRAVVKFGALLALALAIAYVVSKGPQK